MRKHFVLKAILFYVVAVICTLTITGLVNVAIYWFFAVANLTEFGDMLLFRIGLAITETSLAVYCVSQLSEDVLYDEQEEDTDPFEEDEKVTL
jgi:hypothetical protein